MNYLAVIYHTSGGFLAQRLNRMLKRTHPGWFLFTLLFLASCGHRVIVSAPIPAPETFDQFLHRTENVTCPEITIAADLEPAVDCHSMWVSWTKGRERVVRRYPEAVSVKMSDVIFYRPPLIWADGKPYPLINISFPDTPLLVRGVTSPEGPVFIQYSYPEVIEHESTHAITRIVAPGVMRQTDAINDPSDVSESFNVYLFQVQCHNTADDFAGDGPRGNRTDCVQPYTGPDRPK